MPLFWLVHAVDGEQRVFIQEANALIFATCGHRFVGTFIEAHELDAKRVKKVPNKMIGADAVSEAAGLLDRLA
jgi:hypothetical protein